MARCLAFPPPEYMQNGVKGSALLELIKARKDERTATGKRRKKEKRRRKKEEEELEEGEIRETKHSSHKHKKMKKYGNSQLININGEYENYLLERSSLTEELDLPISESLYDSSDSTGHISWKHQGCSRTSLVLSSETCLHCVESQYAELTVNWVPPPIQIEYYESDDLEWLFQAKLRSNMSSEISNACKHNLTNGKFSLTQYPCAQYLPQANISALPCATLF